MGGTRSLQGLMKWLSRDEWRDLFAEVFDRHLLPACERTGVEVDQVISILGQDGFMTTVWGCAFEDFLTRELAGGRNIVIDIIDRYADPRIPEVRNAEGDELVFCTVHYPFAAGATADAIRLALGRCSELRRENATFWNWILPRQPA